MKKSIVNAPVIMTLSANASSLMDNAYAQRTSSGFVMGTVIIAKNEDGDTCSPIETLSDNAPSVEEIICDQIELEQLFKRLEQIMPEAITIGKLRQEGMSDEAIAKVIGIKRTTFRSRLDKAKEMLVSEFPDRFHS